MKKSFFLLCAVLFVLGSILPLAGSRLTSAVLGTQGPTVTESTPESSSAVPLEVPASDQDSETFLIADQSDHSVVSVSRRD